MTGGEPQNLPDCPENSVCIWQDFNYQGDRDVFHNFSGCMNIRFNSISNNTSNPRYKVLAYQGIGCTGSSTSLNPGESKPELQSMGFRVELLS
jgi:Peptidase inhibitor family I36